MPSLTARSASHRPTPRSNRSLSPQWTPPLSGAVPVVAVQIVSATQLRWTFGVALASVSGTCPALTAASAGTFTGPTALVQDGLATIVATYADNFTTGAKWNIGSGLPTITFVGGAALVFPQSGTAANPLTLAASSKPKRKAAKARRAAVAPIKLPKSSQRKAA